MHFIDIIFFAMIAAFLILRLRSVLGRRTEDDLAPRGDNASRPLGHEDKVIAFPGRAPAKILEDDPFAEILVRIAQSDANFSRERFLDGARKAFSMIVAAFAAGDTARLRSLLSDRVFADFSAAIAARAESGEDLEHEVLSIKDADIVEAKIEDGQAILTVRFVSNQVNVVRDAQGTVLEGDPDRFVQITDIWSFARTLSSTNPNWILIGTHGDDEKALDSP